MRVFTALVTASALFSLSACGNAGLSGAAADCGSEDALQAVDALFKEELQYTLQSNLADQSELGSYDAAALEDAVGGVILALRDVRTSQNDPDSTRLACKATLAVDISDAVEREANEVRIMAELGTVREAANRHRLKNRGGSYTSDFNYFVQPTDNGDKLFAEINTDAAPLKFLAEVIGSYMLADEIREAKIAEDQALAEERRVEREMQNAYEAEGAASLNTAEVERQLASEAIQATYRAMPRSAQDSIEELHSAWVKQMNAQCAADAAGSDERASKRKANELACQTRYVRSCTDILRGNINRRTGDWSYCRIR